jgi:signal transduction histidine kinase/DNA-binding NarL/FixJ family response regulator
LVEDSEDDADLVLRALRRAGYDVSYERVDTEEAMRAALARERWDLVISDFVMPAFDGLRAVETLRATGTDLPIIIVSGTIEEELGVRAMKAGASDYILKDNLTRLGAAVSRELKEAVGRDQGRRSHAHAIAVTRELEVRERLVDQMPIGVTVFEWEDSADLGAFRVLWRNPAARTVTLLGEGDAIGTTLRESYPRLLQTDLPRAMARAIETGQPVSVPPLRYGDARVREAVWQIEAAPLGDRLVGLFFSDVTERESLEQQMRAAQRMEAVGRLAGGVAHDFNNLLTVIQSYVGFLLEQLPANEAAHEDAKTIGDAATRAAQLTSQLLAFSRQQPRELVVLNVNETLGELDKMLRRVIGEDVELVTRLCPALVSVEADRTQIEQIVMNLAVNARDAMPSGGKLTIETANVDLEGARDAGGKPVPRGRYAMLAVSDTGVGMAEELLRNIFEPFFTTKDKGRGTGLGLSTVHGIVEQSGGYVSVYSEVGVGTAFKIYLPSTDALPTRATPSRHTRIVGGKERILVAEDEELVRKAAVRILGRAGYEVIEATHGAAALAIAEREECTIHLLLTDIVMPTMSGRDLVDRIRVTHPEMKVIFMSGYTDNAIVHHGVLEEGTAFVQKPFTPETLLLKIRDVLDRDAP